MHLHDPALSNPKLLAHLLACILALRAGQPTACLPLLLELYREYGGRIDDVAPLEVADDDEPYAWDRCYADDPCRDYEFGSERDSIPAPRESIRVPTVPGEGGICHCR